MAQSWLGGMLQDVLVAYSGLSYRFILHDNIIYVREKRTIFFITSSQIFKKLQICRFVYKMNGLAGFRLPLRYNYERHV